MGRVRLGWKDRYHIYSNWLRKNHMMVFTITVLTLFSFMVGATLQKMSDVKTELAIAEQFFKASERASELNEQLRICTINKNDCENYVEQLRQKGQ